MHSVFLVFLAPQVLRPVRTNVEVRQSRISVFCFLDNTVSSIEFRRALDFVHCVSTPSSFLGRCDITKVTRVLAAFTGDSVVESLGVRFGASLMLVPAPPPSRPPEVR